MYVTTRFFLQRVPIFMILFYSIDNTYKMIPFRFKKHIPRVSGR